VLDTLLKKNIEINKLDSSGNSAAFYGIENKNYTLVGKLIGKGGLVKTNATRLFQAAIDGNIELLHGLHKYGYTFADVDHEGRNLGFFSVINSIPFKKKVLTFLNEYTALLNDDNF
jgi:hypothetical protein